MKKLLYPAIFTKEADGYSVYFPDLRGCNTQGSTLEEAYNMAFDALGLYLEVLEHHPAPSEQVVAELESNQFVGLIEFDELKYRKKHDKTSVKKTLTIPRWLNIEAEKKHINFSKVLQNALQKELNITNG